MAKGVRLDVQTLDVLHPWASGVSFATRRLRPSRRCELGTPNEGAIQVSARGRRTLAPRHIDWQCIIAQVVMSATSWVAADVEMRYPSGMQLPVELTDAQLESLRDRAKSLGISPEQLASAAVADLVERPADDFERAASKVLSKNAELYRRLAK
jgi:hypothetical protein